VAEVKDTMWTGKNEKRVGGNEREKRTREKESKSSAAIGGSDGRETLEGLSRGALEIRLRDSAALPPISSGGETWPTSPAPSAPQNARGRPRAAPPAQAGAISVPSPWQY